jgi:ubiquitin-protein ligase
MQLLFSHRTRIRVLKTMGNPPEKYEIEFLVTGLQKDLATQQLKQHNSFIAEITLTGAYPRLAPQCRMLTPVFHPNIAPHAICIGDHWAAGESLSNLVVRIAEMLSFQSYNLKSPLNGEAARWVEKNLVELPLDATDFASVLSAGEIVGVNADGTLKAGGICGNCGKRAQPGGGALHVCSNGHTACAECLIECPTCGRALCLKCSQSTCTICKSRVCATCITKCASCGQLACSRHTAPCHVCGKPYCEDCLVSCQVCGKPACLEDIRRIVDGGATRHICRSCDSAALPGN